MKYFCLKSKIHDESYANIFDKDGFLSLVWTRMFDCTKFEFSRKGEVKANKFKDTIESDYSWTKGNIEICVCEIECKEITENEQKQPKDVFVIFNKTSHNVMVVVDNLSQHQSMFRSILDWYADVYGFEKNDIYGAWTKSIDGSKCPLIDGSIPRFE